MAQRRIKFNRTSGDAIDDLFRGVRLADELLAEAAEAILDLRTPEKARSPRGPLSLAEQDAALVQEMHNLVTSGAARSVRAAAWEMALKADGPGTRESKAKRLQRRYAERFGPIAPK